MKAVTVRVARTNIVIGLSLRQRVLHLLTDGNCRDWRRRDLKQFTPRSSSSDVRENARLAVQPRSVAVVSRPAATWRLCHSAFDLRDDFVGWQKWRVR
jgi:hypothetical protein